MKEKLESWKKKARTIKRCFRTWYAEKDAASISKLNVNVLGPTLPQIREAATPDTINTNHCSPSTTGK